MELHQAQQIANQLKLLLQPHCHRIEIAGSIRRKNPNVKDIEIVAIPKPYQIGLFADGIATVVNQWAKVKGELPCKYTQRILPEGIKLDLFFATKQNWGLIFAIRTGSAEYSHQVLATTWKKLGYKSIDGQLHSASGKAIPIPEEINLFNLLNIPYTPPENRNI